MVAAVILDLDYCLCAGSEADAELFAPVFAVVRHANAGVLAEPVLTAAFDACLREPFDVVAQRFGFTSDMLRAGLDAFGSLEGTAPMHGYGDLNVLRELPSPRFLVTSGFPRLQYSKIDALGIRACFDGIFIDKVGLKPRRGKQAVFADILQRYALPAPAVWVVGDSADSEIAAGNGLGMVTVQMLRPGVVRCDTARYVVRDLRELLALMRAQGADTRRDASA